MTGAPPVWKVFIFMPPPSDSREHQPLGLFALEDRHSKLRITPKSSWIIYASLEVLLGLQTQTPTRGRDRECSGVPDSRRYQRYHASTSVHGWAYNSEIIVGGALDSSLLDIPGAVGSRGFHPCL